MVRRYIFPHQTLQKKLQSIDSKAVKLAIGVPVHTNTSNACYSMQYLLIHTEWFLTSNTYLHIRNCLSHLSGSLPFPCRGILHDPCSPPVPSSLVVLQIRQMFLSSTSAPLAMWCGFP